MGWVEMIAWAAGTIRRSATFFSRDSNMLICSFFSSIPRITGAKDKHACFADAHEHCPGLSGRQTPGATTYEPWDMRSTLCSLCTGAHPQGLIVVTQ
jgi:hypothetical protein